MEQYLQQLLFQLLDLGDVEFVQEVVHEAGGRLEQISFFGRGHAVVVVVGDLVEAVLVDVEGFVVVGLDRGVVAKLQPIEGDAQRTVVHGVPDGHVLRQLLPQGGLYERTRDTVKLEL